MHAERKSIPAARCVPVSTIPFTGALRAMRHRPIDLDPRVRAAWQAQLALAARRPGLLPVLVRQREDLLPRFAAHYERLRRLPGRVRRALRRRWGGTLAAIALSLALGATTARAATITVGGACTLTDAIVAANTDATAGGCAAGADGDTIVLPAGSTHTFSASADGTFGPTALPRVTSEITIAGNGSTLRRDPTAADLRLLAVDRDGDLTLQDTTVTGGRLTDASGGGIYTYGGVLTLTGCVVSGSSARYGGGIDTLGGRVTLTGSSVTGNVASEGGGGLFSDTASLALEDSTISGNTAKDGGGVGGYGFRNAVNVTRCTVSGNHAAGEDSGYGGGIAVYKSALAVVDSTVAGNDARGGGGGIAIAHSVNTLVDHSTIADNAAGNFGGGIDDFDASLVVWNSTVTGNAAAHGGGLSNEASDTGSLLVRFSTIVRNTARETGGGVYGASPFLLGRTIVSGNTAVGGREVFATPSTAVYVNDRNLFGRDGVAGVDGLTPGATDIVAGVGIGAIVAASLADDGGPTRTLALVAGSPAIDAIPDDDFCFDTDQRGVMRPQGTACDVGAYEAMPGMPPPPAGEVCGNCLDDDGDGRVDLADDDCPSLPLASEKGALTLKPVPRGDQATLTATFPSGPAFNPRLEGAGVSLFDAAGTIACVRIPSEAVAPGAWKEKASRSGTTWTFKDAKDGSRGGPTQDALAVQCNTMKRACSVKLKVKLADLTGDGTARTITTGVAIGDDAWTAARPWRAKAKGTKLVTP